MPGIFSCMPGGIFCLQHSRLANEIVLYKVHMLKDKRENSDFSKNTLSTCSDFPLCNLTSCSCSDALKDMFITPPSSCIHGSYSLHLGNACTIEIITVPLQRLNPLPPFFLGNESPHVPCIFNYSNCISLR